MGRRPHTVCNCVINATKLHYCTNRSWRGDVGARAKMRRVGVGSHRVTYPRSRFWRTGVTWISSAVVWHVVRFIPEIANLQGGGSSVKTFVRSRLSICDMRAPEQASRTTFATSRSRDASTGKHPLRAHVFAVVDVVGPPTFFPENIARDASRRRVKFDEINRNTE